MGSQFDLRLTLVAVALTINARLLIMIGIFIIRYRDHNGRVARTYGRRQNSRNGFLEFFEWMSNSLGTFFTDFLRHAALPEIKDLVELVLIEFTIMQNQL